MQPTPQAWRSEHATVADARESAEALRRRGFRTRLALCSIRRVVVVFAYRPDDLHEDFTLPCLHWLPEEEAQPQEA